MATIKDAAAEFLSRERVAVTGVSRRPQTHASNAVYKRLRDRGYQVFAVNPNADEVEGDRAYRDVASIPGGVDAVMIGTRPDIADETMRECVKLGIEHVWMHRRPRRRQRLRDRRRVWPRTWHQGDRRRLPVHVRSDRLRPQGHAPRIHAEWKRPEGRPAPRRCVTTLYGEMLAEISKLPEGPR